MNLFAEIQIHMLTLYSVYSTEILEYATWLGMDIEEFPELLWIAREGIKAPLPDDWKPCKSTSGAVYYFNIITGESRYFAFIYLGMFASSACASS